MSLSKASYSLDIQKSSVHKVLKQKLKFKPYRSANVQRKAACERFLKQDPDWQRRVIWSDEKWFCLKPHPNRKDEVHWTPENPNNLEEGRIQGAEKVMNGLGRIC